MWGAAWLLFALGCTTTFVHPHEVSYDDRHAADTLDVYVPEDGAAAHPAVMFIHGGSWRNGDKSIFWFAAQRLARSGFTVASIDYRLLPSGVFPNNVSNVELAERVEVGWRFDVWRRLTLAPTLGVGVVHDIDPSGRLAAYYAPTATIGLEVGWPT